MHPNINMKKGLSIVTTSILILSILVVLLPLMSAQAGTLGVLWLSDSKISGNRIIMVTVTDPDIAKIGNPNIGMPSVMASWLGGSVVIRMYQSVGGSWFGFVRIAGTITPANPPTQDSTLGPGEIAWNPATGVTTLAPAPAIGTVIYITYNDVDPPASVTAILTIETNIGSVNVTLGTLTWDKKNYLTTEPATITLTDSDENRNLDLIETANVNVNSTSDAAGIVIALIETGKNTGIFNGTITFTTIVASSGTVLKVTDGDTITAFYRDYTVPNATTNTMPYIDVRVSASINAPTTALPIVLAPPKLENINGNLITQSKTGTQVLLVTNVKNTVNIDQSMLYIIQVKDSAAVVAYLGFVSGTIPAGKSFTFSVAWTPSKAGAYKVEVFAWKSWTDPTPLSQESISNLTII